MGRSPGFGSMVGSRKRPPARGGSFAPFRSGWLRLSSSAWTAGTAAEEFFGGGTGRCGNRWLPQRRSLTISRRPIMQKVRLDTLLGPSDRSKAKPFQRFFIPGTPGCPVSPFPHGTCALSVSSSIFRAGGWDPLLLSHSVAWQGCYLPMGPAPQETPPTSGGPGAGGFPPKPSSAQSFPSKGLLPTAATEMALPPTGKRQRQDFFRYGSFQNLKGNFGGGLR